MQTRPSTWRASGATLTAPSCSRWAGVDSCGPCLSPPLPSSTRACSHLFSHHHHHHLQETERGYWLYQARKLYDDKSTLAALPRCVLVPLQSLNQPRPIPPPPPVHPPTHHPPPTTHAPPPFNSAGTRSRYAERRSSLTPGYLRRRAAEGLPFPEPVVKETERPDPALLAALEAAAAGGEGGLAAAATAKSPGQEQAGEEEGEEEMVPQQKTPRGSGRKRKTRSSSLGGGAASSSSSSSSSSSDCPCSSSRKRGSGVGLATAEAAARAAAARAEAEAEERQQEVLGFVLQELKSELFVELMAHFRAKDPRDVQHLQPGQGQQAQGHGAAQQQQQQPQPQPAA